MSDANSLQRDRRKPMVLVETAGLPREEWLAYRRRGIGGSDAAAVMGISPFRTARDLFYDKLNIVTVDDYEGNWVARRIGQLLEGLVAEIFQRRTGYKVYQIKKMFCHPKYPFILADVDYFVSLPDGSTAILEIKTTNYNARDNWWMNGKEFVPVYYESQGRHYMSVMDMDRVFFCCLYGNSEEEVIIRDMYRDSDYEEEMLYLEQDFWLNHVLAKKEPPYMENGDLIMESTRRHNGPADTEAPAVILDDGATDRLMRYLSLQEQKKNADLHPKDLEKEMQRMKAMLVAEMGTSCMAVGQRNGTDYTITYNPVRKPVIEKDNLLRLKLQHPDIYKEYVTVSESRRFYVKSSSVQAA